MFRPCDRVSCLASVCPQALASRTSVTVDAPLTENVDALLRDRAVGSALQAPPGEHDGWTCGTGVRARMARFGDVQGVPDAAYFGVPVEMKTYRWVAGCPCSVDTSTRKQQLQQPPPPATP